MQTRNFFKEKNDIVSEYFCNSTNGDHLFFNKLGIFQKYSKKIKIKILVIPHLFYVDSLILTSTEGKTIDLSCYLLIGNPNTTVNWTWQLDNVKIEHGGRFNLIENEQESSTLKISDLKISDSGLYKCRVLNEYGSHVRNITLRVKSHLAPLWPFLGTLGELLILVILIGSYEFVKRKNSNDQEPLV